MPVVLLLIGCRVLDAPDSLESLVAYAFAGYDDPAVREEVGAAVFDLVARHQEELADGLRADGLTTLDIEAAGVDAPPVEAIVGAIGWVTYTHGLDGVLDAATWPDRAEVYTHTTAYEVLSSTDRACFLSRSCERFEMEAVEGAAVPLLGEATRTFVQEMVWVPGPSSDFVLGRTLVPDGVTFTTDVAVVEQQYALQVLWDVGGSAQRLETFWVEAEFLGIDVPDAFAVDQAVGEMAGYAEEVDEWLSGRG